MSRPPSTPPAALALGWAGVIPFLAAAAATVLGHPAWGGEGVWRAYGAVILSFMGGAQWGLAVGAEGREGQSQVRRYGVSVLPALGAWLSVALAPREALILQLGGFLALLGYDLWTIRIDQAPSWYGRLRIRLSAVVALCLAIGVAHGGWR
ncbi:MAG TPA: DUF3429 domain-containing protein [Caulobacteraceae bacterium]|nr:DUF3429 domain-containing protein [Caulobacteraceae bacterium]